MGSNIEPERHLVAAARALRRLAPTVRFSRVYRTAAVGMGEDAADFLNACALLVTGEDADRLSCRLKGIEQAHGRDRSGGSWRPRTLDLDLMLFDDRWLEDVMAHPHCFVPAGELVRLPAPPPARHAAITPVELIL
ncbi:MAG: 2-amino-4-hydroxy-6-hydroxymethyldihydropteridine diphosphokinase [Zetaproteobacteria bacterium]|nr:MAG: 2-amino-4-hydroxy-6-hydroxymethyldihydropteridine diphosphokinase [Zetaproteobacteria bacterium]